MAVQALRQHELHAEQWRCGRCWLGVRPQHLAQSSRQRRPVPELFAAGARWCDGEASLTSVLGRIRDYRRYLQPLEEEALPAEPVQALQPLHVLDFAPGAGPQRKRMGAEVNSVESGPAPFALRPDVGHSAVHVGRSRPKTTMFGGMAGVAGLARPMLCLQACGMDTSV